MVVPSTPKRHFFDKHAHDIARHVEDGDPKDLLHPDYVAAKLSVSTVWLGAARNAEPSYGPPSAELSPRIIRYPRGDLVKYLDMRGDVYSQQMAAAKKLKQAAAPKPNKPAAKPNNRNSKRRSDADGHRARAARVWRCGVGAVRRYCCAGWVGKEERAIRKWPGRRFKPHRAREQNAKHETITRITTEGNVWRIEMPRRKRPGAVVDTAPRPKAPNDNGNAYNSNQRRSLGVGSPSAAKRKLAKRVMRLVAANGFPAPVRVLVLPYRVDDLRALGCALRKHRARNQRACRAV
jgi:hypothetical protein